MVKFVYKLFIGILLAATIGLGVATFYPRPEMPEYPPETYPYTRVVEDTPALVDYEKEREYQRKHEEFNRKFKVHERNTALIVIGLSLLIVVVAMTMLSKVDVISDGLMVGGTLTLVYGIMRSFGSGDQKFIFASTLVGLLVALVLGYNNFVKPEKPVKKRKK